MSLVVPCPGCPTKLSAPESAAGKQIRCPKCKAVVTVPAFIPAEEVAVVEAKVTPTAPAPKPKVKPQPTAEDGVSVRCAGCKSTVYVVGDIEDGLVHCPKCGFANPVRDRPDEDEDEDDRPRKKKSRRDEEEDEDDDRPRKKKRPVYDDDDEEEDERPRKKRRPARSGGGGGRVVVMVFGVLLLVGVCGVGLYFLFSKGGVFARKAPVPPGWKQYDYPQSGFRAAFPSEPTVFGANVQGFGGGQFGGIEIPQLESMYSYSTGGVVGFGTRDGGVNVTVEINRYSTSIPRASRDMMTRNGNNRFPGGNVKRVRWLGGDAAEVDMGGAVMRMLVLEKAVIVVQIIGPNGARAKQEEVDGFFDNFELTK